MGLRTGGPVGSGAQVGARRWLERGDGWSEAERELSIEKER
jgi:hypothetical protein